MSLVTRCPACATSFKVVPDQLRISDGWVRCGRCSHVFDGQLQLRDEAEPAASTLDASPEAAEAPSAPAAAPQHKDSASAGATPASRDAATPAVSLASLFADETWTQAPLPDTPADAPIVPNYRSFTPFPQIDLSLPAAPTRASMLSTAAAASVQAVEEHDNIQLQKALRRSRVKAAKLARAKAREAAKGSQVVGSADASTPASLPAAQPKATASGADRIFHRADAEPTGRVSPPTARRLYGHRMGSAPWIACAVLLLTLWVLQVVREERDLIVARQPSLRPALQALCSVSGCELSALRRIADVKIDSASFARDRSSDGYRLSFQLRNTAPVPIAMPSVELSLLDTQERVIVRRILRPAEFGAPAALPAQGERAASFLLALGGQEAQGLPPVVGFLLEALYP